MRFFFISLFIFLMGGYAGLNIYHLIYIESFLKDNHLSSKPTNKTSSHINDQNEYLQQSNLQKKKSNDHLINKANNPLNHNTSQYDNQMNRNYHQNTLYPSKSFDKNKRKNTSQINQNKTSKKTTSIKFQKNEPFPNHDSHNLVTHQNYIKQSNDSKQISFQKDHYSFVFNFPELNSNEHNHQNKYSNIHNRNQNPHLISSDPPSNSTEKLNWNQSDWLEYLKNSPTLESAKTFYQALKKGQTTKEIYLFVAKQLALSHVYQEKNIGFYLISIEPSYLSLIKIYQIFEEAPENSLILKKILFTYHSTKGLQIYFQALNENIDPKFAKFIFNELHYILKEHSQILFSKNLIEINSLKNQISRWSEQSQEIKTIGDHIIDLINLQWNKISAEVIN